MDRSTVTNTLNRRTFLIAGGLTALASTKVLGANNTIRVGVIGAGGRMRDLLSSADKVGGYEIVAVSDVYGPHRDAVKERSKGLATTHLDYREVIEKDIDAVFIASPDHWHVRMAIDALAAGKDVYLEKPVSHSIEEGVALTHAVRAGKQILQCGMQQRSWPHFAEAKSLVEAGELGQVTYIRTYWYQNHLRRGSGGSSTDLAKLDWQRWLGSAPERPFEAIRFEQWRWFWDYGGGALTDLFSHWVDVVHWIMAFEYPAGKFLVGYDGSLIGYREGGGLILHGTKAMMRLYRGGYGVYPELPRYSESPELDVPSKSAKSQRDGTPYHIENFLDCVRSRHAPNAPVAVGIAAARAGHLGNIAMRQKRIVTYPI